MPASPELTALGAAVVGAYTLALVAWALDRLAAAKWLLAAGATIQLGELVWRGAIHRFVPLTTRYESLSVAAAAIALVALCTWRPERSRAVVLLVLAAGLAAGAQTFSRQIVPPALPLRSVWYPLHVPLSFLAYAFWAAAAADGVAWVFGRESETLARLEKRALQGFGMWSASMVFGGIWGVAVWGTYFLWDPKIVWSVILWCHYAGFVHLRYAPFARSRPWLWPTLAWVGLAEVLIAFIGTSMFFGGSSHAF